ncbi:MAG: hypothetical protein Q9216_000351 [Gyalolechia sp. 2 TL-2023]
MAEVKDYKCEEPSIDTIDEPRNHACIGHGADGLISNPEFEDACLALVNRYRDRSCMGSLDVEWKGEVCCHACMHASLLDKNRNGVHTATPSFLDNPKTCIQCKLIVKPFRKDIDTFTFLDISVQRVELLEEGTLLSLLHPILRTLATSFCIVKMTKHLTKYVCGCTAKSRIDRAKQAAIHHNCANEPCPCVEYHVLYSPSYQVPVLYFHLHRLPPTASNGLDAIYEWLVPKDVENGLRNHGIIGGISMAVGVLP